MKIEKLLFPRKVAVLAFLFLTFNYQAILAQCTNPTPTGDISQVFCKTENSTIAYLSASGGDVVWYDAPTGGTLYDPSDALVKNQTYYADDISGNNCSTSRLAVTVSIYGDIPKNVNVYVGVCVLDNSTIADLSATGENIAWYDAQTGGNLLPPSHPLVNGGTYWVQQTENGCTSDRFPTTVSVIDPITPTTNAVQSFCSSINPNISNLQSSGTTVLWYDTETSTTPLKTTDLLINGNDYWVAEIAYPCVSSNRAKTTVAIDTAPNAGNSNSLLVCEVNLVNTNLFSLLGGSPDTGGTWTAPDGSAHSETFVAGTDVVGIYTYTVAGSAICADDSATVTIAITVIPAPTITDANQSFCIVGLSSSPTLADLTVDAIGTGNSVIWYDSQNSTVALPLSTVLTNNTTYWASQLDSSSGCESASRDSKTALIDITPNAGTDGSYSNCEINMVNINLFSLLGGTPDTGGTWTAPDGAAHSETFVAGTDVAGIYTYTVAGSTICPDDSATVTIAITTVPPPTTTTINQSFCKIENPKVSDLSASGSGILWYASETSATPLNSTELLINGASYWASQTSGTSGCESIVRLVVTVIIYNPIRPTTTDASQEFCLSDNPTVANLLANASNAAYTIVWYDTTTSSTPLTTGTALIDGATYYAAETILGCESADRLSITVTINDALPPTISTITQSFCASSSPKISDLNVSGDEIVWYASETDSTPLNSSELLVNGENYWAAQTNPTTGCVSSIRKVVNVILTDPGAPAIISRGNEFCIIDKPMLADLDLNVSANNGGTISWYDSYPNGNLLSASTTLVEGETYYAIETLNNGCKTMNPLAVTVSLEACDQYDIVIYDGFSPTGNGINDTFKIGNLRELYPNFKVEFYNRWGNLIYTANAGNPDWNGRLNGNDELSPAGVYYFVIHFNKNDRKPIQRRLYLSR